MHKFQTKEIELTILDTVSIKNKSLCSVITDYNFYCDAKLHFVAVMDKFLCVINLSAYQLCLLNSSSTNYVFNNIEQKIVTLARAIKVNMLKDMFVFENHDLKALHFIANESKTIDAVQIIVSVVDTSSLEVLGIDKCKISNKCSDQIQHILRQQWITKIILKHFYKC